jgi:predicted metal-binding membrane protein
MTALRLAGVPIGRGPLPLVAALFGMAAVGWLVTGARMSGMDAGPGTDPGALGFFLTAWVVMMGAMMFPSVGPMVVAYDRIRAHRREIGKPAATAGTGLFIAGYLVSWTAFGLLGWGVYQAAHGLSIDALAWDRGGPYLAGGVILLAAAYELTPLKHACLRKCRSPMVFLFGGWRDGSGGALRLGVEHGAWCIGCCWALMAALFALGVMSIPWMAFVAALIAAEKLLPWARSTSLGITVLLAVIGLSVALAPDRVPGLVLPDSAQGREARMMTHGGSLHDGMKPERMGPKNARMGGSIHQRMHPDRMGSKDGQMGGSGKHDSMGGGPREAPMAR